MTPSLAILLCLGLSMDSAAQRQPGVLPRPVLWAEPGPVVPRGRPVTLWCEGDPEAQAYLLHSKDGKVRWSFRSPVKPGSRAAFFIPSMTEGDTGRYQCIYLGPAGWSDFSEPLRLVVTGQLSSTASPSQRPGPREQGLGLPGGEPLGPISSVQPVSQIHVPSSAAAENASAAVPPPRPGPRPDHRVHNLVRVGLGLLVLVALTWIVVQAVAVDCGHGRKKMTQQARDGCQEPRGPPGGRGLDVELGEL